MIHVRRSGAFQSTLPRRERPARPGTQAPEQRISIHAPAKGATCRPRSAWRRSPFQSTLPRRERHPGRGVPASTRYFNPRSREGSDGGFLWGEIVFFRFQSTLPRRERPRPRPKQTQLNRHFNPRSREGSDVGTPSSLREHGEFQSTLPRRERRIMPDRSGGRYSFQSTLPRRERHDCTFDRTA